MHKKSNKGEKTEKVIKRMLSFLYARYIYCHDQFYITVKNHQNISNGFQVIERTQKRTYGWTDARLFAISPELFDRGI